MRMIGVCNILDIQRHISQTAKIGYWIGERYRGLNFGKSAVSAVTNFCFNELSLNRVEAAVMVKNAPSISILKALGYKKEGISRQKLKINGKWEDHYIFSRIASDTLLKDLLRSIYLIHINHIILLSSPCNRTYYETKY